MSNPCPVSGEGLGGPYPGSLRSPTLPATGEGYRVDTRDRFRHSRLGLGAGMLANIPLSALAHSSFNSDRADLLAAMREGGLRAFLDARDGKFIPEPFGPKSTPKA